MPAPDSGEPAQKSEPTKAVIAGSCNEIKKMLRYPSSGVSDFDTLRLEVKAFLSCIFSHWLSIFGHKEGYYISGIAGEISSLLPHTSVAMHQ